MTTMAAGPDTYHLFRTELPEGLTYRMLDYWTRAGYLRPANGEAGRGFHERRRWTDAEVEVARVTGVLRSAGLGLPVAALAARAYSEGHREVELAPGFELHFTRLAPPAPGVRMYECPAGHGREQRPAPSAGGVVCGCGEEMAEVAP